MSKKINTQAMFFPGFYESVLENSDMVANEIDQFITDIHDNHPRLEVDEDDDVEVDYKGYEKEIAAAWARGYASYMPDFVISCEFESVVPPRNTGYGPDYRFGTDKLYVDVEMEDNWLERMKAFISENQEWFEKRIGDDWSSYDGFWSFMENNLEGWLKGLEDEDERYIGTTLAYMMLLENDEFWEDINMEAWEAVSFYAFIGLTPEKQKELEELAELEEKERRIKEYDAKHQLTIDFIEYPKEGQ